jgi:ferric-dicitrate binding protein FerR (iron transport regulator)
MSDAPANPIDAIACQWAARLDRGLAGEEEAALDAWLALDPRHRGALLRAQAGMALLDRCRALHDDDAPEQAPQDEAPDDHARWGATRRQALALAGVGVAGGLIGAAGLALWPQGSGIRTRIGEMRRVPLADGSMAVVNSGSELNVSFTPAAATWTWRRGGLVPGGQGTRPAVHRHGGPRAGAGGGHRVQRAPGRPGRGRGGDRRHRQGMERGRRAATGQGRAARAA